MDLVAKSLTLNVEVDVIGSNRSSVLVVYSAHIFSGVDLFGAPDVERAVVLVAHVARQRAPVLGPGDAGGARARHVAAQVHRLARVRALLVSVRHRRRIVLYGCYCHAVN